MNPQRVAESLCFPLSKDPTDNDLSCIDGREHCVQRIRQNRTLVDLQQDIPRLQSSLFLGSIWHQALHNNAPICRDAVRLAHLPANRSGVDPQIALLARTLHG